MLVVFKWNTLLSGLVFWDVRLGFEQDTLLLSLNLVYELLDRDVWSL